MDIQEYRKTDLNIDNQFLERWSPRALSDKKIPDDIIESLFEAARWSPSCFNEQPWLFLYADDEETLSYYRPLIVDANRVWSDKAPLLIFLVSRNYFLKNNKNNQYNQFDAGAAWMSLALQARKFELYAHAMAGIHFDQVYEVLNIPKDQYDVICAIAVGYRGNKTDLPENLLKMEMPNQRKTLSETAKKGKL